MAEHKNKLLEALKYLKRGEAINEGWTEESPRSRDWEGLYRGRWQHDKVVRSTHGVNCTGSLQLECFCQGRHYHLGNAKNGLSDHGSQLP